MLPFPPGVAGAGVDDGARGLLLWPGVAGGYMEPRVGPCIRGVDSRPDILSNSLVSCPRGVVGLVY